MDDVLLLGPERGGPEPGQQQAPHLGVLGRVPLEEHVRRVPVAVERVGLEERRSSSRLRSRRGVGVDVPVRLRCRERELVRCYAEYVSCCAQEAVLPCIIREDGEDDKGG